MAMTKDHKAILQEKRTFLLENIKIEEGINILDLLFRDKIITSDDLERIMEKQTQTDKIRHLLDLLPRCGSLAFNGFVAALLETNQEFVAAELHNNEHTKILNEKVHKKLVAVGDGATGKTCLLEVFSTSAFPKEYVPTVFNSYTVGVEIYGHQMQLVLWDTAGQDDYRRLRPLSYPGTDVFLICFDIKSRESLENVTKVWLPEVTFHCGPIPIILVGTKLDLRNDVDVTNRLASKNQKPVSNEEGKQVAEQIKAVFYSECSALTKEGVPELLEAAALVALKKERSRRKEFCVIL